MPSLTSQNLDEQLSPSAMDFYNLVRDTLDQADRPEGPEGHDYALLLEALQQDLASRLSTFSMAQGEEYVRRFWAGWGFFMEATTRGKVLRRMLSDGSVMDVTDETGLDIPKHRDEAFYVTAYDATGQRIGKQWFDWTGDYHGQDIAGSPAAQPVID